MVEVLDRRIAYFSMEIALEAAIPTYSGGLGVLAGDTIRSAADLAVPMVAVTLLHRKGYFSQTLDADGTQHEKPEEWVVQNFLKEMPVRAEVWVEGRRVLLRAWEYRMKGVRGFIVPIYFLDSDLAENSEADRKLTHFLYAGDAVYRFSQEIVLGIGGVHMLRALGYQEIRRFHMNEGHASLLTLALLDEEAKRSGRSVWNEEDVEQVRHQCVFTTHTPVPSGHDQFPLDLVKRILGDREPFETMKEVFCCEGALNLTYLALNLSHFVNGVAKRHGEISQRMFARYRIDAITNGVHVERWTSRPFQDLFDRYIPGWREDNFSLRYALKIPGKEVWAAHLQAKQTLLKEVGRRTGLSMNPEKLTIGFARRATAYKRPDLLFEEVERLRKISKEAGQLQVIYAGKAHPNDEGGKKLIRKIFQARETLREDIPIVYLENYDLELAKLLTAGVDLWLNTPQPPLEASGTSGMKAALNGVPSLSVLDGWWMEGHIEGVTGWSIDGGAQRLYEKLEKVIVSMFYRNRDLFIDVMSHAIALNGSFFNTQRMVQQYVLEAYFEKS